MKKTKTFDMTISEATHTMPLPQRWFSGFLHSRPIAWTSDVIGGTIARPNALLYGAVLSFIVTLSTYLLAKNLGYRLSGFEPIAGFGIGWILGLLYDLIRSVTKKK